MGVVDKVCMFHPAVQKNKRTIHSKSTHPLNWTGSQEYDYVMQTWKIDWTMWKAKGFTQVPNTVVMGSEPVDLGTGIKTGYRVPHLCPRPWEDPQAALEGRGGAARGAAPAAGGARGDGGAGGRPPGSPARPPAAGGGRALARAGRPGTLGGVDTWRRRGSRAPDGHPHMHCGSGSPPGGARARQPPPPGCKGPVHAQTGDDAPARVQNAQSHGSRAARRHRRGLPPLSRAQTVTDIAVFFPALKRRLLSELAIFSCFFFSF